MRIPLSEFELPGTPGVPGDVVYTAIDYDINTGKEVDGHTTHAYLVCGYRENDGAGVLIHGTKYGGSGRYQFRVPRLLSAPEGEGITPVRTEFHGVESLEGPYVRLVGCVETKEKPGVKQGFFYEGWLDGTGDWYPISLEDSDDTVVKHSRANILVCSDNGTSDSVFVYDLENHKWTELHCGYADPWEVSEVIPAGDIYVIRLLHSDGRRSDLTYKA